LHPQTEEELNILRRDIDPSTSTLIKGKGPSEPLSDNPNNVVTVKTEITDEDEDEEDFQKLITNLTYRGFFTDAEAPGSLNNPHGASTSYRPSGSGTSSSHPSGSGTTDISSKSAVINDVLSTLHSSSTSDISSNTPVINNDVLSTLRPSNNDQFHPGFMFNPFNDRLLSRPRNIPLGDNTVSAIDNQSFIGKGKEKMIETVTTTTTTSGSSSSSSSSSQQSPVFSRIAMRDLLDDSSSSDSDVGDSVTRNERYHRILNQFDSDSDISITTTSNIPTTTTTITYGTGTDQSVLSNTDSLNVNTTTVLTTVVNQSDNVIEEEDDDILDQFPISPYADVDHPLYRHFVENREAVENELNVAYFVFRLQTSARTPDVDGRKLDIIELFFILKKHDKVEVIVFLKKLEPLVERESILLRDIENEIGDHETINAAGEVVTMKSSQVIKEVF
jgi:hypothetical protein